MTPAKTAAAVVLGFLLGCILGVLIINVAIMPAEGTRCFPIITLNDAYNCGATHK